ncbi:D-aspartate oxidase-like [Sitodiplosis mosellana]|uniref:D-aspartate oxidase-like n=1 Tax=Sitodiplosis mosellana TaxID=263140 RepID=UPI0024444435|nr:D-aspartate oxidase-like [Sitodiplosis mosellana]
MSSTMQVAIIGAGVIGTTTAIRLQEQFANRISLTIFSDQFSPKTTGDISAGLWGPYQLGNTPQDKIFTWSKDTHNYFHKLWKDGVAEEAGVSLLPVTRMTTEDQSYDVPWKDVVFGCTDMTKETLERLSAEHKRKYKYGIHFNTFICEPTFFLPYLYKRIQAAGGRIERKRIESFEEVATFDLVINCTGLGAQVLIKDDYELKPVRGQVMRVKAPWIFDVLLDDSDDGNYIISNMHTIILGGTHQLNDYNQNVDAGDRKFIYEGCIGMNASIKRAEIVKEMVGLRPGRSQVRLERDTYTTKRGKQLQIIHNYGHGGSGVTLSYGCAIEVADIVNVVMATNVNTPKSKL